MNYYDHNGFIPNQHNAQRHNGVIAKRDQEGPILIDLDHTVWEQYLDRVGRWLGQTLMAQVGFYQLTIETIPKIQEPHIKSSIIEISQTALLHVRKVEELYTVIERNPHYNTYYAGEAAAKFKEAIGRLQGMLGGAGGDWQMLHQLYLSNMNALDSFAVTEQFGLTLGLPEITTITLNVIHQKQTHQLILKEYMLEMASISILYNLSI